MTNQEFIDGLVARWFDANKSDDVMELMPLVKSKWTLLDDSTIEKMLAIALVKVDLTYLGYTKAQIEYAFEVCQKSIENASGTWNDISTALEAATNNANDIFDTFSVKWYDTIARSIMGL